jgi:heme-degrading monooxygenase HmoA
MHATIRRWNGASTLIAEIERRAQEVENVISSTPGFVAYHALRSGNTLVSVTVCQDKAGTDESTRRAVEWVRENLPADALAGLTPEITEGQDFLTFQAPQRLGNTRAFNTVDVTPKPTNEAPM